MGIEEIEIKRKCKICNKFHFKKTFIFEKYANVNEFMLDIEWHLFKIEKGITLTMIANILSKEIDVQVVILNNL